MQRSARPEEMVEEDEEEEEEEEYCWADGVGCVVRARDERRGDMTCS